MGTRRQRPAIPARTAQPSATVHVRHLFEDLAPALRPEAMRLSGGDRSRVRILSRTRFEVLPPKE